jgi:Tfp pilus assembly protein PilN
MIFFNKKCAVITIEPEILSYQVVTVKALNQHSNNKNLADIPYQNSTDIEQLIQNLKKQQPKLTAIALNLGQSYVQFQKTAYPEVKLNSAELTLYVKAIISKLFQLPANNMFFDFVSLAGHPKTIMIAICESDTANYWIDLSKKHGLTLLSINSKFENIQFNFLPWRQKKASQHQFQLLLFMVSFIGLLSCFFFYLLLDGQTTFTQYSKRLSTQQVLEQQLSAQLASFIPNPSPSQKQIQQSLQMFAEILPETIWLRLYEYEAQKIKITGQSINYVDIINFNQQLLSSHKVNSSQVKNIENIGDSLLFQMDIELNE